jgi:hypothetical protein
MSDDLLGPAKKPPHRPWSTENALRHVLLHACPPDPATGQRSIMRLSKLLGVSDEAIFKWIRLNRIPPLQAAKVVDVSEGRVTLGTFTAFIFLENEDAVDANRE